MPEWFEKVTFGSLPDQAAARFGDREALYFKGQRWSFAELADDVDRAAKGFLRLGIQPGEKVSLWVPNRPEFIHLFFALPKIGAIIVPINTFLRSADTAYMLKQSDSTTLITVDQSGPIRYLTMVHEMLPSLAESEKSTLDIPECPELKQVVILSDDVHKGTVSYADVLKKGEGISDKALQDRADTVDPDGTVFIMYTSGTTGFPKGVMHCHNVIRNITDEANRMAITCDDVIIMYLPLFHAFGLYAGPLISLVTGARQVLTERFDPQESLSLVEEEKVTLMHGFDTHFKDLIEFQEKHPKDLSSLRTGLLATGMKSSVPTAYRAHEVLCAGFISAYGMSEIGVGACLSFHHSTPEQRCEASGYPSPGYEIRIIDPKTGEEQPIGEPGEILVRGYMVMQGYYNEPEETAKTIDSEGWLHTGDMGVMRPDGHLRFVGRFKEMLKTGGENVDPMEVEGYLLGHPAIHQVAIVGYPDERLSEVGVAFIHLEPGQRLEAEAVIDYCKGKIATFKIPRHVIFIDEYPMTGSGKIKKVVLKEMALEALEPQ
ncbi:MAG: AMP-binding protein [Desulfobacterales bacterium]